MGSKIGFGFGSAFCFLVSIYYLVMLKGAPPDGKKVYLVFIAVSVILGIVFAVLAGKANFTNIQEEKNKM
jgi:hypothetical protein